MTLHDVVEVLDIADSGIGEGEGRFQALSRLLEIIS
jgi:hypothetical protein